VPLLLLLALTGVTALYILQFTGVSLTSATSAAVLINTNVLFIAVLARFVFAERFTSRKVLGLVCGFAGVALLVTRGSLSLTGAWAGNLLVVGSAFCWAVYSVAGKHVIERSDPLAVNGVVFFLGTVLFLPFVYDELCCVHLTVTHVAVITYLALACSIFAYVAWYDALSRTEASKVAIFLNLIPLFTFVLAGIFDVAEEVSPSLVAGAALILAGVYLSERG
jgi:drug/metabolite transporter (DMT)-like permease